MTWRDVIKQTIGGYQAFAAAHPELVDQDVAAGSEVSFVVDAGDLGAITVTITVPAPLAPASGSMQVAFPQPTMVTVPMPTSVPSAAVSAG